MSDPFLPTFWWLTKKSQHFKVSFSWHPLFIDATMNIKLSEL